MDKIATIIHNAHTLKKLNKNYLMSFPCDGGSESFPLSKLFHHQSAHECLANGRYTVMYNQVDYQI
jgi:hypothetical protein